MKITASVRPVIRLDKKKKDGTCPIHFSVRVGAFSTRMPSGKSIIAKDWDVKNNCPKRVGKENTLLATYLIKRSNDFNVFVLERETLGKPVTLTIAMEFFRDKSKLTLYKFWEDQLDLWQMTKKKNTLKSYRSTLNILKEFNSKLTWGDVNLSMLERFDLYMRKDRNNATGGCFTKHKCLKSIIKAAIMKGHMKDNPYQFFKIKSAIGKRMFLSLEEVNKVATLEIAESNGFMNRVRDLFLFSCYTGLRYSDVMNLKWANVKDDRLEMTIIKTDRAHVIPLVSNAKRILSKYSRLKIKNPEENALPKMANQVINRELKELMKLAGIDKIISFHCARHTFASNLVEARTSIVHIKDLLAHSDISTTQIYARTLQADLFESMDKLDQKHVHAS